jgi:hypothetical protein
VLGPLDAAAALAEVFLEVFEQVVLCDSSMVITPFSTAAPVNRVTRASPSRNFSTLQVRARETLAQLLTK